MPFLAPAIPAIIAVGGLALSAAGAKEQTEANMRAAQTNSLLAERNASIEQERATFQEARKRKSTEKLLSRQRAIIGKTGLDVEGFRPLIEETVELEELDALAIRRGGSLNVQSELFAADFERGKIEDIKKTGKLKIGSTLLTGGSRLLTQQNRVSRLT